MYLHVYIYKSVFPAHGDFPTTAVVSKNHYRYCKDLSFRSSNNKWPICCRNIFYDAYTCYNI